MDRNRCLPRQAEPVAEYGYKVYGCLIWLATALLIASFCFTKQLAAKEQTEETLKRAINLVVMIDGQLDDEPSIGAGIIISAEDDGILIATANHVVRRGDREAQNLRIRLRAHPDTYIAAKLLSQHDPEIDLAVIRADHLAEQGVDLSDLSMNLLATPGSVDRGDLVFPVGHPNGIPWGLPVVADAVAQVVAQDLIFQSDFISAGHSGGGLIEESGLLLGMIIRDQPPFGMAVDMMKIRAAIESWEYPFGLEQSGVYDIGGEWEVEGHDFGKLTLIVNQNELSGKLRVGRQSEYKTPTTYGSPIVNIRYTGHPANVSGSIKGNKVEFRAEGTWSKEVLRIDMQAGGTTQEQEFVDFAVRLKGTFTEDLIRGTYEFDYPSVGKNSSGEFVARKSSQ